MGYGRQIATALNAWCCRSELREDGEEATVASLQLRAGGTSGWAVAEGKEKMGCNDAGRSVSSRSGRAFGDGSGEQRNPGGCDSDGRASSVAVTETAALPRLVVTALIVMVPGANVRCAVLGRRRVLDSRRLHNREAAVHRTGVQLRRLGQTNGEPEREHAGETARDPIAVHGSNIR